MVVSDKDAKITTFGVGTCLAVVIYDPSIPIGGMMHIILPDSSLNPQKALKKPAIFADTAVPKVISEIRNLGGDIDKSHVLLTGGAQMMTDAHAFKISEQTIAITKKLLEASGIKHFTEDLGGKENRTLHFEIATGEVEIKTSLATKKISLK